ncbi:MAG: rRNA maturation RNase YbeY [Methylovirgula sp.]|jgi:probable rRNA maturation factor
MNDPASSCGIVVEIAVESPLWETFGEAENLARQAVSAVLAHVAADIRPGAELSFLFCDDATIQELNRRWRGQDKPTNVLSFPSGAAVGEALSLGDIVIAFETMAREATQEGKSLAAHFVHLTVHGLLHLLGYDHETDDEAEAMEETERQILADLGIDDPYRLAVADTAGAP